MDNTKIYDELYEQTYNKIKELRDPHADDANQLRLGFTKIEEDDIFSSSLDDFNRGLSLLHKAKINSIVCLSQIIIKLGVLYHCDFEVYPSPKYEKVSSICFTIYDKKNDKIMFFKDKEYDLQWNLGTDKVIEDYKEQYNIKNHIFVYLLYKNTKFQFIGGATGNKNYLNITDFFEIYFGSEEKELFIKKNKEYNIKKNEYIGLHVLKTLSDKSSISLRRIFEKRLLDFHYEKLLNKKYYYKSGYRELKENDYKKIYKQFIDNKFYRLLLYNKEIAESLITAEWLYDTLKNAQAIDLTPIAVGFLKAVEQVIFTMISLYKDKNDCNGIPYMLKERNVKNRIPLTQESITNECVDTTMGAFFTFYNYYCRSILSEDISKFSKQFVSYAISNYTGIRNGYLHKHNITNWDTINMIRDEAYYLFFLVIGSQRLTDDDCSKLKLDKIKSMTDFDLLCEFIDYHTYSGDIFLLKNTNGICHWAVPIKNLKIDIYDDNFVKYSELCFKLFNIEEERFDGKRIVFNESNLPNEILIGRIDFIDSQNKIPNLSFISERTIFKDGKMLCSIIDDIKETHF